MAAGAAHTFLGEAEGEQRMPGGNLAGSRRPVELPEFGARELVMEIDSAQKIARELDRQLRGSSGSVRRTDAIGGGSVGRDSGIMSQAAVGEEIMDLTDGLGERLSLRSGASFFNVSSECTPARVPIGAGVQQLTHAHTRMVSVAVIDRQAQAFSEQSNRSPGGHHDETTQFQVQESTVMPQRTGMSLLMFEMCCAKPRMRRDQKKAMQDASRCTESGISMVEKVRRSRGSSWDPGTDAHLTTGRGQVAHGRARAVELSSLRTGGWT